MTPANLHLVENPAWNFEPGISAKGLRAGICNCHATLFSPPAWNGDLATLYSFSITHLSGN